MFSKLIGWVTYFLLGFGSFGLIYTGYCRLPAGHAGDCIPETR
jgi:hypothetical protein